MNIPEINNLYTVETSENVRFQYRVAGIAPRLFAYLIDLGIRMSIFIALIYLAIILNVMTIGVDLIEQISWSYVIILLVYFILDWLYYVISELATGGRSLGKMALGLRVIRDGGFAISVYESFLRNLLRVADLLPSAYAVGCLTMFISPNFKRLGDMVAGTIVIYEKKSTLYGLNIKLQNNNTDKTLNNLKLSSKLSLQEEDLLFEFINRIPRLNPNRVRAIAEILAEGFSKKYNLNYTDPILFLRTLAQKDNI